jgi:hypothetical protein
MRKLGVLARGEVPRGEEASDLMRDLNRMIGSWNNQNLLVKGIQIDEFLLTPGKKTYTLGPGGDFDIVAPVKTKSVFYKVDSAYQTSLDIIDSSKWGVLQGNIVESDIPTHVFIDNDYPLQKVRLYPTPSTANTLVLHNYRVLEKVTSLTQEIDLQDGYELALVTNLALAIAPDFGKTPSELLYKSAMDSLKLIKRTNTQNTELRVDKALTHQRGNIIGGFN